MPTPALQWSDEQSPQSQAASRPNGAFAWSDEKEQPSSTPGPVTLNQKRGGSTVTEVPHVHGSDIDPALSPFGPPGALEKRTGGASNKEFLTDMARPIGMAAATVAPMMTAGASVPVEMAVSGLSGAAQSKLAGGSNKEAAISGGIGAVLPFVANNVPGLRGAMRRVGPPDVAPVLHGPAAPPEEVLQGRGLATGAQPVAEPSAGLGKIPVRSSPPIASAPIETAPAPTPVKPSDVQGALEKSLGGQKLVPGVPLRNQPIAQAVAAGKLPEGFTPIEGSSALKGYKYNPDAREFESITQGGQHYVHGDVSPEEAKAFENADSKGKAWQQIRNNPLVAKVVNGKRVPIMKAPVPETPEGEETPVMKKAKNLSEIIRAGQGGAKAPAAAPEASSDDLTGILEKSLQKVKAKPRIAKSN